MTGTRSGSLPVEVAVRYERFPATVKGAFVMRGADGDPHGVRVEEATVERVPHGPGKAVPLEEVVVDVAPARDLFVPFEVSISDLDPGWYTLVCRVKVDGGKVWSFSGRPFSMAWPRGENRRGVAPIGRTVRVGGNRFLIDRVEMSPDHALMVWKQEGNPPMKGSTEGPPEAVLLADGASVEALPDEAVPAVGRAQGEERRVAFYPVPKAAKRVQALIRLASGQESDHAEVPAG
jgi:hypothetical protein